MCCGYREVCEVVGGFRGYFIERRRAGRLGNLVLE